MSWVPPEVIELVEAALVTERQRRPARTAGR